MRHLIRIFLTLVCLIPALSWAVPEISPLTVHTKPLPAETNLKLPSGASFWAPAGWHVAERKDGYLLLEPEKQLSLVICESRENEGTDAIQDAWKIYFPEFELPILKTDQSYPKQDWDLSVRPHYFAGDSKDPYKMDTNRVVGAWAHKKGRYWYVILFDGLPAAFARRAAQFHSMTAGLEPPGGGRETPTPSVDKGLNGDQLKEFSKFVEEARKLCGIPGAAVAIVQGGQVALQEGYGLAEKDGKDKVTAHTRFAIASITKPLTTLMMARLVDKSKIAWESPITTFLPGFRLANPDLTQKLTMRTSVCACSGLPRRDMDLIFPSDITTPEQMLARMATLAPTTGFGETFQYSNDMLAAGGYAAARSVEPEGTLAEAFAVALQREVLDPLGMKETTLHKGDLKQGDHALPHVMTLDEEYKPGPFIYEKWMDPVLPAGGVWSSVADMAQYICVELAEGKLPDGTLYVSKGNLLQRRQLQVRISPEDFYGLGLFLSKKDGILRVGHGGTASGYSTDLLFLPELGMGLVVLNNAQRSDHFNRAVRDRWLELLTGKQEEAKQVLERWMSEQREFGRRVRGYKEFNRVQSWVYDFAGTYVNDQLGKVVLRMDSSGPVLDQGNWRSNLIAYYDKNSEVRFLLADPPMTWSGFSVRDEEGHKTLTYDSPQQKYLFQYLEK